MLAIPLFSGRLTYNPIQVDEIIYKSIVDDWNEKGIVSVTQHADNKPLTFLYLQKQLDGNYQKTRILNIILILFNTLLLFKLSNRYESFLYPIIPFFLNSMWLTVEIIETLFILLSFMGSRYQGVFIGIAALFRPYAAIFSLLQTRKQTAYTLTIGLLFSGILFYNGLFFSYLETVFKYGTSGVVTQQDYMALMFLVPMAMICFKNKILFRYGLVACVPLIIRMYGHYFITPYSIFFLGWLQTKKD